MLILFMDFLVPPSNFNSEDPNTNSIKHPFFLLMAKLPDI